MVTDDLNYKVWGVDNVVYGPVDANTMVSWLAEERINGGTWIYVVDQDRWLKVSEAPEFAAYVASDVMASRPVSASDTELNRKAGGLRPGSLRRVKIFASMSDEQLVRFLEFIEIREVRQFAELVKQGDPGDAMYFVMEGEVRVRLLIGGRESILATLSPGDFFGEIALFDHGPRSADVVANKDSILLRISAANFQKLAEKATDLATPFLLAMGRTLTGRIRADNKRFRESIALARGVME